MGRLTPNRAVTLSVEVGGIVDSYDADVGDKVEKGQTLVKIDPTDYLLALKEAEASLEVARARLNAAKKSFDRTKSLPKDVISPDNFEKVEADFKSSRASVERVKVLVDINKEKLKKTQIKAPFTGFIAERFVEKGQIIGIGQPVVYLVDLTPMRIMVHLAEMDYVLLDKEDKVSVIIEACPQTIFNARIDLIGIKADERTNTFDVEILVDNPEILLKAGMTARVGLTVLTIHDVIMIPQSTILYRKDRTEVFVVGEDEKAEVRTVELGRSTGKMVHITKGLTVGDRLVTTGGQYLKTGDKVMIPFSEKAGMS
jgi:RND family efflux transporter MFP subunit